MAKRMGGRWFQLGTSKERIPQPLWLRNMTVNWYFMYDRITENYIPSLSKRILLRFFASFIILS